MRKNCYDPVCPANKQFASTSRSKSRSKKRKVACYEACPTTSRTSTKPRKRCSRSKKRSKEQKIKICKNKKCRAARCIVESSTSIHVPEKICVRSTESVRSCRSRLSCQDSRSPKRITCTCHPHRSIPLERKKENKCCRFKKCRRQTRQLIPLCICVRTCSSENFRSNQRQRSSCPVFSKYGECCCIRHRRKRSFKETPVAPRRVPEHRRSCKCRYDPSTLKTQQNVFLRGLSFFGRKIQKLRHPFSNNPKPSRPRVCRSRPIEKCCSRSALKRRNDISPERRKVKFCK